LGDKSRVIAIEEWWLEGANESRELGKGLVETAWFRAIPGTRIALRFERTSMSDPFDIVNDASILTKDDSESQE
jgi:hypothetical protein